MDKEHFLNNLEIALKRLMCDHLYNPGCGLSRDEMAGLVEEFISENAGEYTLGDLQETFVSAEVTIGLFYEYQDAKNMIDGGTFRLDKAMKTPTKTTITTMGDTWSDPVTGMVFVWIPGGCFEMGAGSWDDQGAADELPAHEIWLDGFWIGKYPVTVAQYNRLMVSDDDSAEVTAGANPACGNCQKCEVEPTESSPVEELPKVDISFSEATEFVRRLAKKVGFDLRLPSEAQWEYAARSAGKEEKYAGGYEPVEVAWFAENSDQQLQPVGRKKPNGLGLYDMCGNVSEWCRDHYLPQAYAQHDSLNPVTQGQEGDCHVVRGGSFCHGAKDVRCADRGLFVPDHKDQDLGFRLVRMR